MANTFKHNRPENQVTYHELWQNPLAEVSPAGFQQLNDMLVPRERLWQVRQIRSDPWEALATHNFLLEAVIEFDTTESEVVEYRSHGRTARYDLAALRDPLVKSRFAAKCSEFSSLRESQQPNRALSDS